RSAPAPRRPSRSSRRPPARFRSTRRSTASSSACAIWLARSSARPASPSTAGRSAVRPGAHMKIGLFSINPCAAAEPRPLAGLAGAAEAAGFESLWAGEHVVLPDPQAPPSPMAPTDAILDPAIALTYAAAVTTRVRLGTGIVILPQRNPLVLAKELASLDVLSGGRLIFGIGVGYLEPEFRARGARCPGGGGAREESPGARRGVWSEPKPT